ncbi:MAG: Gfo/Idh/MocA family oxidoreductase [Anaerolineales bacterium]|nr:Gfo/Idh/MocA family oxidoreductase [Anaerolineales bacterium]
MAKNIGIIGLGNVSEVHLQAYRQVDGIRIAAGAEPRVDRLSEMSQKWGFQGYTDYLEMLQKEKLDIVCILTPAAYHRPITEKAAEHGVNILCEKPMALSIADCQAMIDTCQRNGVKFYYGSSYRHLPAIRKAKEMIDNGLLGDIQLIIETVLGGSGLENWQSLNEHHCPAGGPGGSGMGLVDHGIHLVDVFRWLTNSEAESVYGFGNIAGEAPITETLTINYKSGAVGQLVYCDISYSSDLPYEGLFSWGLTYNSDGKLSDYPRWEEQPGSIRVHGSKGALRIFHYANKLFFFSYGRREQIRVEDRPHPGNFAGQMESFVNSLINETEPEVTGLDGLLAVKTILPAFENTQERRLT